MLKLASVLLVTATWFLISGPLLAHERTRRVCRIVHPSYYLDSLGRRGHGRYGVRHFRSFHRGRSRAALRRGCRIDHPVFFYRSPGRRSHGRYGLRHYRRFHADYYRYGRGSGLAFGFSRGRRGSSLSFRFGWRP